MRIKSKRKWGCLRMIRRVYVAGAITPYKSEHPVFGFLKNISRGIRAAVEVVLAGFAPFCPFLDHQYWHHLRNGENITETMIKACSMAWLEVSEAVLVLPRYRKSQGTLDEIARAKELGIPVFYNLDALLDYCESEGEKK